MYSITLFPEAILQTGTGQDKRRVAPHATFGILQSYTSFEEVVQAASHHTVSLNEYSTSEKCRAGQVHRLGANFIKTNLIGLDIDDNLTIEQAIEKLKEKDFQFGLYTSFNHSTEKPKFRVILELSDFITDEQTYKATWESLHKDFLGIDASCKDTARLYFHSNPANRQVIVRDGSLVPVVHSAPATAVHRPRASAHTDGEGFESATVRNKLPIEVRNWLAGIDEYGDEWAPAPGERSAMFYKLALLCKERGYSAEWCDEKLGARLRSDRDYMQKYGGSNGVDEKIHATLAQIFSRESRHGQPDTFTERELSDARLYIQSWVGAKSYKVNHNGIFVGNSGILKTPRQIMDTIHLDYDVHLNNFNMSQADLDKEVRKKVRRVKETLLDAAVKEFVFNERQKYRTGLKDTLAYNGAERTFELEKFVRALTGKDDPVALAAFQHFIWQVKRKIFGLKVTYHQMLIVTGGQGVGKSEAVKMLYSPMKEFVTKPTLSDLADKKQYEAYEYNYIAFCDEMEKAEQTDIDGLKNFITTDTGSAREMYSSTMIQFTQNCTAIGCANHSLSTLIYDPTGMRRFFEITADQKMKGNESGGWDILNSLDYIKLWQEVNENLPGSQCYILPFFKEVEKKQEDTRMQDPIEIYLDETQAGLTEGCETVEIKTLDFYSDYRIFCNKNGHRCRQSNWFGAKLKEHGIYRKSAYKEGQKAYTYTVNANYRKVDQE